MTCGVSSLAHATNDSTHPPFISGSTGTGTGTGTGSQSSPTPRVTGASPYQVEFGYSDPNIGTSRASGSNPSYTGYMETIRCFEEAGTSFGGVPPIFSYCVVKAITIGRYEERNTDDPRIRSGICPRDFSPVYNIVTEKSGERGDTFACPQIGRDQQIAVPKFENGRYTMLAAVSATTHTKPDGTRELVPANGFTWEINCYPGGRAAVRPPVYNVNCYYKPPIQEGPLLWDTGVSSQLDYSNSNSAKIITPRMCPLGYKPYAVVTMAAPDNFTSSQSNFDLLNNFSYCTRRIAEENNRYAIYVLFSVTRTPIGKSSDTLTINDHNKTTNRPYLNVQWQLYCYPPTVNPPFDYTPSNANGPNGTCQPGVGPY